LEKSEDGGKTFRPVRDLPIVPVLNSAGEFQPVVLGDSLANNDKEYLYRLRGTSPFGDIGPYSKPVAVVGVGMVKGNISWDDFTVTKQNTVILRWKFMTEWEKDVEGFAIERAGKESGPYKTITTTPLSVQTRQYEDKSAQPSNYYRLITIGKSKRRLSSTPFFVQLEDSIPPSAPVNLNAMIDSVGITTLQWQANKENDLLGYHASEKRIIY
jgi:hypothetical protein